MKSFLLGILCLGWNALAMADEDRPQGNVTTMIRDDFKISSENGVYFANPNHRWPTIHTYYRDGNPVSGCPISTSKPASTSGPGTLHFAVDFIGMLGILPEAGEDPGFRTLTRMEVKFNEEVPSTDGTRTMVPRVWSEVIDLRTILVNYPSQNDNKTIFHSGGIDQLDIHFLNKKGKISNPISDLYVSFCDIAPGMFSITKVTITDTQDL
jgi:hypothetical protein